MTSGLRQWSRAVGRVLPPGPRRTIRSASRTLRGPRGAGVQAEVVASFDAWAELDALATSLHATLVAAGVSAQRYAMASATTILIPEDQREAARVALTSDPWADRWHVSRGKGHWQPLAAAGPGVFDRASRRIFRVFAASNGAILAGPELSVPLIFIPPSAPDADPLPLRPQRHRHLLRFDEPIDAVYTWVDGSDPDWRRERAGVDPGGELALDALSPSRTADHDEMRYSLRSLAMYANWVRHIWIVTSGQVPGWLDTDHPRITVVPHRDIFSDPSALPTFNSHAIESQLHHIEGLAEHFIYLNDDVFFGRPVAPTHFFHGNGIAKYMTSAIAIDREPDDQSRGGAMLAGRNNRALMEKLWGHTTTHRMQHVPHAHRRSSLEDLERRRPDVFDQVARQRFRSPNDVSVASELGHYHAHALGLATPGWLSFRYIDIASPYAEEYFDELQQLRSFQAFCVNDVNADQAGPDRATPFLEEYFPVPSPFESS